MVEEEDGIGDGELGVAHEELEVVVHGVVRHLHAVLGIHALGGQVILYEHVGLLVQRVGELEMRQGLVVRVGLDRVLGREDLAFCLRQPVQVLHAAAEQRVDLVLI